MWLMGTNINILFFFIQKGGMGVEKFPILKMARVICSSELEAALDGILLPRKREQRKRFSKGESL